MRKALLIIDMLNDFLRPEGALYCGQAAEAIIPAVAERIKPAREDGELILYLCDNHRPDDQEFKLWPPHCVAGSWGAQVVAEIAPQEGDVVIPKRRFSGFFGTDLLLYLVENRIEQLELVGVCTHICVMYTAADARNLSYPVRVSASRVASFDEESHRWGLQQLEKVLGVEVVS